MRLECTRWIEEEGEKNRVLVSSTTRPVTVVEGLGEAQLRTGHTESCSLVVELSHREERPAQCLSVLSRIYNTQ